MAKKMGRPRIEVNWEIFETACKLLATKEEICGLLGVKEATLQRRIKEKYKTTFEGVLKKLGSNAKVSLRRYQFKLAEKNATMAIWLGKQYLGQRDDRNDDFREHETVDFEFEVVKDDAEAES